MADGADTAPAAPQPASGPTETDERRPGSPGPVDARAPTGGGRLLGYVELLRPGNAAMAAAGGAAGFILADGAGPADLWLAATLPPFLIAAFGNVVNDLRDMQLDRAAHPRRPLPSGRVRRREAWLLAALLLLGGLAWTQDAGFGAFALAGLNALLLGVYEARLKAAGLPGNVLVGLLVGSTFLYGGLVATGGLPTGRMLLLLACLATLTTVARELLKDVEDLDADRGHRATFPLRFGPGLTRLLALGLVNAAVLATLLAFLRPPGGWWLPWLVPLGLADAVFVLGACWAWMDVGAAQRMLKLAMAIALAAFLAGPLVPG